MAAVITELEACPSFASLADSGGKNGRGSKTVALREIRPPTLFDARLRLSCVGLIIRRYKPFHIRILWRIISSATNALAKQTTTNMVLPSRNPQGCAIPVAWNPIDPKPLTTNIAEMKRT